mmetsp:Transcript_20051/g.55461  ORF Transcript_20051/g.55461 Transcript_20051/m.55461 type:complete len:116 (-) Transcript_20051:302-649(-)
MMAYLIYKYAAAAASGGDQKPLILQVPAALLLLAYPVQELITTEIKRGGLYPNAVTSTPLAEKLKFRHGLFIPLLNFSGVCLTIAASILSAQLPQKIQNALRADMLRTEVRTTQV